ncbi:MAG: hypothetical protein JWO86_3840 [Myxococcaceae bacterium]|nr:hypothetical protein [Myxococcaceae bacterium]
MMTPRASVLSALLPLLACCGGRANDAQDPGIEGTLVFARADLHAVLDATASGDIIVVTDDGSLLALDSSAAYAATFIGTFGGDLRHDLQIEIAGGAVLVWRDRGHDAWELDAWSRALGLRQVATDLAPPTSDGVTSATLDGQRIVFATGGRFTNGVGSDLLYYGVTLTSADVKPVQLARMPAGTNTVEIAVVGDRVILKRYRDAAINHDPSNRGWPQSEEPWKATLYDATWQPIGGIAQREDIVLGDSGLRVATEGADGELAIVSLDGSPPISVDHDCRFAEAFFMPGDEDLVYTCRGAANRFHVATGALTALGDGMTGAYPLQCGDARCRDWVGGPGPSVVALGGGAPLAGPETDSYSTPHGDIHGHLSPDGRFAIAATDSGATAVVEVGHLDHRIVLDREARGVTWLDGARFVYVTTTETNKYYEDAASVVIWRDPSVAGTSASAERVITRNVYSPFARTSERALYAIAKRSDRPKGLYRFPLSGASAGP